MTVMGGVLACDGVTLRPEMCVQLREALSRRKEWKVQEYRDRRAYIAKIDVGAFGETAYLQTTDGVSALVGEALIDGGNEFQRRPRVEDLEALRSAWRSGELSRLQATHGSFAVIFYDAKSGRLSIASDKLGLRCVYYWRGGGLVVFATALRVLESLPYVAKGVDLQGITEAAAFGYPLIRRTPYREIHCLDGGEIVHFDGIREWSERYWRWDTHPERGLSLDQGAELFRDRFERAVRRRLRLGESSVVAFLTGGLDSRCVVTALAELGRQVQAVTFAAPDQLDGKIASSYAAAMGMAHHAITAPIPAYVHPSRALPTALPQIIAAATPAPDRSAIVWSGDGGSVGLGYVYLTEEVVARMKSGALEAAVTCFLRYRRIQLPLRFLTKRAGDRLRSRLAKGMREHLSQLTSSDPTRAMYLFLLLNDQRRHLFDHLEDIDLTGIELVTPFFDSDVLEVCASVRVEEALRHRFYYRCLDAFPEAARSVPWQAYPGHLPCPLPVPSGRYQWSETEDRQARARLLDRLAGALGDPWFPRRFVRRERLVVAQILTRLGLRDYSWLFKFVLRFHDLGKRLDTPLDFSRV